MNSWAIAGLLGLAAGGALVLGAAIAWTIELPHRVIAAVMGFGSGVLISVLAIDLVDKSFDSGGSVATLGGFFAGTIAFSAINWWLSKRGAKDRNRCGGCVKQPREAEVAGSGLAIAVGALLDGIPESLIIGLSVTQEGAGLALVIGFFIANVPQGLSSATGMKQAGRGAAYVFSIWGAIAIASGIAAVAGHVAFQGASSETQALISSFAAGAILAMLAETLIPEAFEKAQSFIGAITGIGFLCALLVFKLV